MLDALKAEMAKRGVSAQDLAECTGRSARTVRNWLAGHGGPSYDQSRVIRNRFFPDMTLEELFGDL